MPQLLISLQRRRCSTIGVDQATHSESSHDIYRSYTDIHRHSARCRPDSPGRSSCLRLVRTLAQQGHTKVATLEAYNDANTLISLPRASTTHNTKLTNHIFNSDTLSEASQAALCCHKLPHAAQQATILAHEDERFTSTPDGRFHPPCNINSMSRFVDKTNKTNPNRRQTQPEPPSPRHASHARSFPADACHCSHLLHQRPTHPKSLPRYTARLEESPWLEPTL